MSANTIEVDGCFFISQTLYLNAFTGMLVNGGQEDAMKRLISSSGMNELFTGALVQKRLNKNFKTVYYYAFQYSLDYLDSLSDTFLTNLKLLPDYLNEELEEIYGAIKPGIPAPCLSMSYANIEAHTNANAILCDESPKATGHRLRRNLGVKISDARILRGNYFYHVVASKDRSGSISGYILASCLSIRFMASEEYDPGLWLPKSKTK